MENDLQFLKKLFAKYCKVYTIYISSRIAVSRKKPNQRLKFEQF